MFGLDLNIQTAPDVPGVTYISADVTDDNQVRAAVAQAADFGPPADGGQLRRDRAVCPHSWQDGSP